MSKPLDADWCASHPLPTADNSDKGDRGTVLVVGGSTFVPGAPMLAGEAVLRSGAGRIQIAIPDLLATAIGVTFPESAVIGLPIDDEGEISPDAVDRLHDYCGSADAIVIGPGMSDSARTADFVERMLATIGDRIPLVLDAGAMTALVRCRLPLNRGATVLTPHHGELATMTDADKDGIARDPERAAIEAAQRFNAIVVLKSATTFIAKPDGIVLRYDSPAPGLGTAGSGDVLAGTIGGLLARGIEAEAAAGWGIWLHGQAGVRAGSRCGKLGFLAREVLPCLSLEMEAAPHR